MLSSGWLHRNVVFPAALWLRGEHRMYRILERLEAVQWSSRQDIENRQREKLTSLLRHASGTVPRYRRTGLGDADTDEELLGAFRRLPPLTKSELQEHGGALVSEARTGRTTEKTTSGSTGEPVTVRKNASAVAHERAATWMSYGWFGIRIGDPCARFWGSRTAVSPAAVRERLVSLAANQVRFSAFSFSEDDLDRYWRRCVEFRPEFFYGYVSMLTEFSRHLRDRGHDGRRLGLKAVVTTAEALTGPQRDLIEATFGAPVQNEYGCGEVGPVAYECPDGSLHVMSSNVLLEVLDDDGDEVEPGEPGYVHVTDLNNVAMPLIRYRVGDLAVRGEACSCGRGFPVLERVWGREYDFVEDVEGRKYHGEYFLYIFEELSRSEKKFDKVRVVQPSRSTLVIEVQAPRDFTEEDRAAVKRRIEGDMSGMRVRVREVEEIPRLPSGKSRVIENRWARDGRT